MNEDGTRHWNHCAIHFVEITHSNGWEDFVWYMRSIHRDLYSNVSKILLNMFIFVWYGYFGKEMNKVCPLLSCQLFCRVFCPWCINLFNSSNYIMLHRNKVGRFQTNLHKSNSIHIHSLKQTSISQTRPWKGPCSSLTNCFKIKNKIKNQKRLFGNKNVT